MFIRTINITYHTISGHQCEKTCLRGLTNNIGADRAAYPRSLISAFVIGFLEIIMCRHDSGEISIFSLASVAEETGLKFALLENPKTGFVTSSSALELRSTFLTATCL